MNIIAIFAATAALNWTMPDGKVVAEAQELVPFDDGVKLALSREKILSMNAKRLDVIPDFACAKRSVFLVMFSSVFFGPSPFSGLCLSAAGAPGMSGGRRRGQLFAGRW